VLQQGQSGSKHKSKDKYTSGSEPPIAAVAYLPFNGISSGKVH